MKNEIGRKLTSLTIMAIMFAGGMAIGVPSFMPVATADFSITDGVLSASSEYIQGAAILEIVVNDPDYSAIDIDIGSGPTVDIGGTSYDMVQAINGKWYLYVVDDSQATLLDADAKGMEFGVKCTAGLGLTDTATIIASGTYVWTTSLKTTVQNAVASGAGGLITDSGGCHDIDNMMTTLDDTSGTTSREDFTSTMLRGAPTLSNHNDAEPGATGIDLGQRGHGLNASGYGSWPYILSVDFADTIELAYGDDSLEVAYGNTDGQTAISLLNNSPADSTHLALSITDPALNVDPTGADVWRFNLAAADTTAHQIFFANNGSNVGTDNAGITLAEMGDMGCSANCALHNSTASALSIVSGLRSVYMTETGSNTGVFDSWATNGTSQIVTLDEVGGDKKVIFTYGGNSADMIITYNNASIEMDAGSGDWLSGTAATVTLTDPDSNKYPTVAETLAIGDETYAIPTIKIGNPFTLKYGSNATNDQLNSGDSNHNSGVQVGFDTGHPGFTLNIYNTTDDSERLRIIHSANTGAVVATDGCCWGGPQTYTWINVTTGTERQALINLPGTVVLNYDVSGPAGDLKSTAVAVYVTDAGINSTNNAAGVIGVNTAGNIRAGVFDLDDDSYWIKSADVSNEQTFSSAQSTFAGDSHGGDSFVLVAFKITHPQGYYLNATHDYAIAADFCNFDQDNGSNVHNCIYRLEAEETGANTGVFTGTVEYVMLNNSTSGGLISGEHDGNDEEVEGYMTNNSDAIAVALMSTGDDVRITFNDTDALQGATKVGSQVSAVTHTGVPTLDADSYGDGDLATITIVDADLNQDSSVRDTYENSSRTFQMTITKSDGGAQKPFATKPMTIIETGIATGVFVGTFKVPNYLGSDMELAYYESLDASGSSIELYDIATITSNSGSVSFDRSVYPVPFASADLRTGANNESNQTEAGNVTMTVTIDDADYTSDELTTSAVSAAGTILIKLIQGTTSSTCFTAGSAAAHSTIGTTSTAEELGPLAETEIGSHIYEVEFVVDEVQHCGTMKTIVSGDVFQVEYVDAANDSGSSGTVYDSSTFDLRTGSLSVDKDVYVLGSDMVVTLTDPDLNLDSGTTESYAMTILEWDSDADSSELLDDTDNFVSNPSSIQETGDDTGVFQTVVTIPSSGLYAAGDSSTTIQPIDFGEAVTLTYVDVGLSGESTTEVDVLDVEAYFSISNFGALVELDKAVYNWTDTVYITITSPDHNTNSAGEETIGTALLPIQVTTRNGKMCTGSGTGQSGSAYYIAAETGPDTGVFEADLLLAGYAALPTIQGKMPTAVANVCSGSDSSAGVIITAGQTDGISVSYEYTDAQVVVASASILFNIAEAGFDTSSASAGGSTVFTVTDADENTNNALINSFSVAVYSDSDSGGFNLTVNETDEDTGVFEGTVFFTSTAATSGSNLRVSEGDTVTAEYTDSTLPEPYTDSDTLTVASTLTIGTAFPPLERAPAANARVVDAFGSSVAEVSVDQQVQIAADVSNGQNKDQAFAYLVQVQDENGVTVSLAWITGSLTAGQSMSPALSWTPGASGSYTATVFVWESVDNPTALSPTTSVSIDVV